MESNINWFINGGASEKQNGSKSTTTVEVINEQLRMFIVLI